MKRLLKRLAQRSGFDVIRFNPRSSSVARRIKLFRHHRIDLVLDVGASTGGYGLELRGTGYQGRIVSFEPSSACLRVLQARAARDAQWDVVPVALGDVPGQATLNLSHNRESSSLLRIRPRHTRAYPGAAYAGTETVAVERLDTVFAQHHHDGARTVLKIDTQGYEQRILAGAEASLPQIAGVQVELSLVSLYDDEPPFMDLVAYLLARGYTLMSVQPVIDDPDTGQLLQVDGLFFRAGT